MTEKERERQNVLQALLLAVYIGRKYISEDSYQTIRITLKREINDGLDKPLQVRKRNAPERPQEPV